MAKKASGNLTPSLFGELAIAPKPLPLSVQVLFLPKFVGEAARHAQIQARAAEIAQARQSFQRWIENYRSGQLAAWNETQLEQDFTTGLLEALGYRTQGQVSAGQNWSAQPKWSFPNAGIADVALGDFETGADGKARGKLAVVVELKGPKVDLDRRDTAAGRSPVQQAFDYLSATDSATRWAIVSNYVEFRLYSKEKGRNHVHRVLLDDLDDEAKFREFFAVFHADSLLSDRRLAFHAAELLRMTEERQKVVGDELYELYADKRYELIKILQAEKGVADLDRAIRAAQTLLDRVLFIAFAEDRKLLGARTKILEETYELTVPMRSVWDNFRDLFRAFDVGHQRSQIPPFNGGLFARDEILDAASFELDDSWPNVFQTIGKFDFKDEVTVEVLGEIFERSITELETLRERGLDGYRDEREKERGKKKGQRRKQGVFYTNEKTVGYLVGAALDPAWHAHRAAVAAEATDAAAVARALLQRLDAMTVCDPACGSGAFLIAAYGWFEDHRMALLEDLAAVEPDAPECVGGREDWRARCASWILGHNLYGVDLASEAVEIARLSLWIRTARKDQKLTDLSRNVVEGNSVVDDATVDPRAFHWHERFPDVFARGGFDAVVGNPPYVRQEWLGAIKPHLAERFRAYHGMADLYVYFYERGLQVLKPGGRLAFVVTNKWMKAGYGEPLRRHFAENAWVEEVVDFGHAKQFFPDADVFPCFLVIRKPDDSPKPEEARVCVIPREMVRLEELKPQIATSNTTVGQDRFNSDGWSLESHSVVALLDKIRRHGTALAEFTQAHPLMGIKTGFNDAFLIDTALKDALIASDPTSSSVIRPFLRGQDIDRWHPAWAGLWMIALKSSGDHPWPWANLGEDAETCFAQTYPSLYRHLKKFEPALRTRQDHGRYWWELRSCAYWDKFASSKILYQDITWTSSFCFDTIGTLSNNTVYFLPTQDLWIAAVLNSPVAWWYSWRAAQHGKDEALRFFTSFIETFPIPNPNDERRAEAESEITSLIEAVKHRGAQANDLLDWLAVQFEITEFSMKLRDPVALEEGAFIAEVKKARGKSKPLTAAGVKLLRREYATTIEPARARAAEALALEVQVSDLVNAAYGLTPDEIRLMWETAPPRMPIPRPAL